MENQSWEEERSFKTEYLDLCLNVDCVVLLIGAILVLFIFTVVVLAVVFRRWKMKKREKITQRCRDGVSVSGQYV